MVELWFSSRFSRHSEGCNTTHLSAFGVVLQPLVSFTRLQHDEIASGLPLVERNYGNVGVQQPLSRVLPGAEAAPADWHEELRQGEGVRTDVESSPTPEGPHTIEA